jgi:hypothetical protein
MVLLAPRVDTSVSLALAHFALGGLLTALVLSVLWPSFRFSRTAVLLGGGVAMVPDLEKLTPVYRRELAWLHDSAWADLFWFHRALDRADPADDPLVAVGLFVAFLVGSLLAELYADYRSRRLARRTTADEDRLSTD